MMLSVVGHLLIVAVVTATVIVTFDREKIVAPDRIQIMEIDLTNIKITRDETMLANTDVPPPSKAAPAPKPEKKQEPIGDDKPIDKPSAVDSPKTDVTPENHPKATTVVRVNRETMTLNRTMTISVIDALRVAMTKCWVINQDRPDVQDMRVVAHLELLPNGMVQHLWFEGAAQAETDAGFAYVVETIRSAVSACQPFSMLPREEYDAWKNVKFNFYPSSKSVQ